MLFIQVFITISITLWRVFRATSRKLKPIQGFRGQTSIFVSTDATNVHTRSDTMTGFSKIQENFREVFPARSLNFPSFSKISLPAGLQHVKSSTSPN